MSATHKHLSILALAMLVLMGGCTSVPLNDQGNTSSTIGALTGLELLGQTELPPGSKILPAQSLIIGAGDNWVGRVSLDAGQDSAAAYSFFLQSLPAKGWTLLSAVRGPRSILVFNKSERTVTIDIMEGNAFGGAKVEMTMAPRNAMNFAPKKP